jgi:short-subunit dehydrogenase
MRRTLQSARILLTGATGGLGQALAQRLAARGARLLLTGRNQERLQRLTKELRSQTEVYCHVADLTLSHQRAELVRWAEEQFGALEALINNAGVGARGLFENSAPETLRVLMEVNFFAPAELTRECLGLLARGNRPILVNISSVSGRRGFPIRAEYCASKFALTGLSEVLRAELAIHGIDVLIVSPGHVRTDFAEHFVANTTRAGRTGQRHARGMPADQAAERIVRAMEKGKREIVFPFSMRVLLWVNRMIPGLVDFFCARHCRKHYANEAHRYTAATVPWPQDAACRS